MWRRMGEINISKSKLKKAALILAEINPIEEEIQEIYDFFKGLLSEGELDKNILNSVSTNEKQNLSSFLISLVEDVDTQTWSSLLDRLLTEEDLICFIRDAFLAKKLFE